MEALTRQQSSELPGNEYWNSTIYYFGVTMRMKSSKRVLGPLSLLVGLVVIWGCGIHSKSPTNGSENNANVPSPSASTESSRQTTEEMNAVRLVSRSVESNKLNVTSNDLKAKKNPRGDGVFVYVPQTRFFGIERYVIWMVFDSKGYALNSPSKMVTPSLPWSRDADVATWNKTGINRFNGASEAIDILFGK